jgi:hypothetical protein
MPKVNTTCSPDLSAFEYADRLLSGADLSGDDDDGDDDE